jgi:hypothetical protein
MRDPEIVSLLDAADAVLPVSAPRPGGLRTVAREAVPAERRAEVDAWVLDHGGHVDFPARPARPATAPSDLPGTEELGPSFYEIPPDAGDGLRATDGGAA